MKLTILRILLMAGLILAGGHSAWSASPAEPQKVLILRPAVHGPEKLAYLGQGLVDMLSTRLASPGKVVIVGLAPDQDAKGPATPAVAAASARQAGADHVVFGSITLLGDSISTDLRMLDVNTEAVSVAFSQSGSDPSALIEHADLFAAAANDKVFGGSGAAQPKTVAKPSQKTPPPADTTYQHPEKLLQQAGVGDDDLGQGSGEFGAVLLGSGSAVRGPRIRGQIQGVAIGDVDGDGMPEVVAAGLSKIWVYKFTRGKFVRMTEIDGRGNYIGLDLADVNDNGRAEIFVTNFDNDNGMVSSFVMEYDKGGFKRTAEFLDLYFRAMNLPDRGRVLFGQRRGLDKLFQNGIFEMVWENGRYRKGPKLKVPRGQNIFGMGVGSLPPSTDQMIFAYDSASRLQVVDPTGRQEWISASGYGSVAALVQFKNENDPSESDYYYVAGRLEVVDLDGDGTDEAVALYNDDITGSFAKRSRVFKHGRLEIFKADEFGMSARVRTRFLPKFISDFAVGDLDQDGKAEILTAVVQKTESVISEGRTNLYLFNVDSMPRTQN